MGAPAFAESHPAVRRCFLAYATGENMHPKPEIFDDLRSYWGQFAESYLRELPTQEQTGILAACPSCHPAWATPVKLRER